MDGSMDGNDDVSFEGGSSRSSGSCCSIKAKRWLTNITMACFFLCGGIEYSVILPTCWDYLHEEFGAQKWLYGLTISAMSISNLLIGPIMGAIYDKTHQTKILVLFLNLFEIGGNFMYFAATSKHMVLGSRFITGIGVSAGAVLFGEIARTSDKKRRTVAFSIFMSARQVGLVIGPGLNLFLRICNFNLGPFKVDKFRSPALFMMIVWVIIQVLFLFFFFLLPSVNEKEESDDQKHVHVHDGREHESSPTSSINDETIKSEDISFPTESAYLVHNKNVKGGYGSINVNPERSEHSFVLKKLNSFGAILNEFVTEQVSFLLAILFITLFNQQVLETGLVPLVEDFFDWNEFDVSLFYSGAGIILLISFFSVAILTKTLSDRWLIVIGIIGTVLGYTCNIVFLGSGKTYSESYSFPAFIIGSVINVFTIPYVFVPAASLYSKFLPLKIQGFGQGIRRSVGSLACIMGPLWAGSGFELSYCCNYYPFFGVPLVLLAIISILLVLSFSKLKNDSVKPPVTEGQKS